MKPIEVSPTGLQSLDCERYFAFKYWSGLPIPITPQLSLGTDVHSQIELYLTTGSLDYVKNSKAATIAAKGLHLLPTPLAEGLSIEGAFRFELTDVVFSGRMDWMYPWMVDHEKYIVVGDNKTSSDPQKWGKTPEQLENDYQAIIYGFHGLQKHLDAKGVYLKWVYFPTKNKGRAAVSQLLMEPHELVEKMHALLPKARRVVYLRTTKPEPNSLEPNTNRCNDFGGCPYRHACNLSEEDTIRSFFKMSNASIPSTLAALAARLGAPAQAVVTPDDVNPPENAAHDTEPPPPPSPAASQAFASAVEKLEEKPKKVVKSKPATKAPPASVTFNGSQTKCIGTLYVNCIPPAYTDVAEFIAMAKVDIRSATKSETTPDGVADYRLMEYGKGPGYLSALVEEKVKAQGLVDRLVVDVRTPEGAVVLGALSALANEIVRGV